MNRARSLTSTRATVAHDTNLNHKRHALGLEARREAVEVRNRETYSPAASARHRRHQRPTRRHRAEQRERHRPRDSPRHLTSEARAQQHRQRRRRSTPHLTSAARAHRGCPPSSCAPSGPRLAEARGAQRSASSTRCSRSTASNSCPLPVPVHRRKTCAPLHSTLTSTKTSIATLAATQYGSNMLPAATTARAMARGTDTHHRDPKQETQGERETRS